MSYPQKNPVWLDGSWKVIQIKRKWLSPNDVRTQSYIFSRLQKVFSRLHIYFLTKMYILEDYNQ